MSDDRLRRLKQAFKEVQRAERAVLRSVKRVRSAFANKQVHPPGLMAGRLICAAVLLCASAAQAQQPTFPFLQDGGARNSFVRGTIDTCLKTRLAAPESRTIPQDRIVRFCDCYARAIADVVNGEEYEAMIKGQALGTFRDKVRAATAVCEENRR